MCNWSSVHSTQRHNIRWWNSADFPKRTLKLYTHTGARWNRLFLSILYKNRRNCCLQRVCDAALTLTFTFTCIAANIYWVTHVQWAKVKQPSMLNVIPFFASANQSAQQAQVNFAAFPATAHTQAFIYDTSSLPVHTASLASHNAAAAQLLANSLPHQPVHMQFPSQHPQTVQVFKVPFLLVLLFHPDYSVS